MENPILAKRKLVQDRIEKSFDSGINVSEEVEIEKAHQDGEIHPNGKWVWVSSANGGKGDWRTRGGRTHNAHSENEKKFKQNFKNAQDGILQKIIDGKIQAGAHEKKWAQDILDERKKGSAGDKAAAKIIDLIKISNSKYSDISKVVAFKTDKGNWAIDYDGANTGLIIGKDHLSEAELKAAGVKIEGANANKKTDNSYASMDIKDAKKELVGKQVTITDLWGDGRGGSQDAVGEITNVRLYGKNKVPVATIKYGNGDTQEITLSDIDKGELSNGYKNYIKLGEAKKKADPKDDVKAVQNISMPDLNGGSKSITLGDGRTVTVQIKNLNKENGYVIGKISGGGSNQFKFGGTSGKSVDDAFDLVKKDLIKNIGGSTKKADPKQDKAAQAAGFKDYEEMKGWQDYTTAKNLLKKPSMKLKSKEADRKELEKQVADYEKDHADVIAARGGKKSGPKTSNPTDHGNTEDNAYQAYKSGKITKEQYEGITGKKSAKEKIASMEKTETKKTNDGNFKGMKFTEILDSLDEWEDDDWNNQELNEKLTEAIKGAIKKEGIDEKKFKEIAKKYQGLDLVYEDYTGDPEGDFAKLLKPLDDWEDEDWNDDKKNKKLSSDIKGLIMKHKMSESDFRKMAKKYQGLDLVYTDYVPKNSDLYKKYNGKA